MPPWGGGDIITAEFAEFKEHAAGVFTEWENDPGRKILSHWPVSLPAGHKKTTVDDVVAAAAADSNVPHPVDKKRKTETTKKEALPVNRKTLALLAKGKKQPKEQPKEKQPPPPRFGRVGPVSKGKLWARGIRPSVRSGQEGRPQDALS